MAWLLALLLGTTFGIGLIVAGMTEPVKVLAFLDIAGRWDPSLALVMGGAIGVAAPAYALARRRTTTWLGTPVAPEANAAIDAPLLLGSVIFGIGWGLSGFCPGSALVGLGAGKLPAAAFVIAMAFGMEAYEWLVAARMRRLGTL
ncbi:DUF6691 family protein [Dechloromonas sp. H13]|uniref:DUF6691 family protein n=1 Tax=Dechloromonas sp. H13 TaxID=2570193 RepID=UPI001291B0C5|nr:DUF6691 family protein [Dechloromonas sp. H13]